MRASALIASMHRSQITGASPGRRRLRRYPSLSSTHLYTLSVAAALAIAGVPWVVMRLDLDEIDGAVRLLHSSHTLLAFMSFLVPWDLGGRGEEGLLI